MKLANLGNVYLHGEETTPPANTRNVRAWLNMDTSTATLEAIAGRDTNVQPVTLAEMQALGFDTFAVELAAALPQEP